MGSVAGVNSDFLNTNRTAWDRRAMVGARHTGRARADHLQLPLPVLDPEGWFEGAISGRDVLCLASGGGLQSALCAAAGARVTVVDLSPEMLRQDVETARAHGFSIRVVEADMRSLDALGDASFDLVIHPVSTCYVPEVRPVFEQVARVLRCGGIYVSQHKQPASQQAAAMPSTQGYVVREPCVSGHQPAPIPGEWRHREPDAVEFIHTLQDLLGGLCASGFVIEALREPQHGDRHAAAGTFEHRSAYLPPFVKLKARRKPRAVDSPSSRLILAR